MSEQIVSIRPWLVGKDPLEIDTLYSGLGVGTKDLSGTRTDGSAHKLIRAASGIEMALGILPAKSFPCRPARCLAADSATGSASTIMKLRRTCWIRHNAASGHRRSVPILADSRRTNLASHARIRKLIPGGT